jgi:hypothetical protein
MRSREQVGLRLLWAAAAVGAAQLGHAALWDPLFLIWGALLAAGLRLTRDRTPLRASGSVDLHVAGR